MAMLNFLLATFGFLVTLVSAETYYIVPTDNTSYPTGTTTDNASFLATPTSRTPLDENATCLTLTQYAQLLSEPVSPATIISSITLIFVPGNHTLGSHLRIQNVKNLILQVVQTNSSSLTVALVTCTNFTGFIFEEIPEVSVSSLVFSHCQENSVRSVHLLRVGDCRFQNGHGIELRNVMNATVVRSTFLSLTAFRETWDQYFENYNKSGGAIIAFDTDMLVIKCQFELNRAVKGGAIWTDNGSISIHGSNFSDNRADDDGGAIQTDSGSISIHGSNFSNNRAGDNGGAIQTFNGSISIHGSNFSNNRADFDGGAIQTFNGSISIHGSNFSNNTAGVIGGAIWTLDGSISIHGSNFSNNRADFDGGAIQTFIGSISIHGSNFSNNTAGQYGGAIQTFFSSISIHGSNFSNNTAGDNGGAIQTFNGSISIHGSNFSNNKADFDGGAIRTLDGSISIHGSNFSNNRADFDGGAIQTFIGSISIHGSNFSNNTAGQYGGAIQTFFSSISIHGSNFSNNTAGDNGGAIQTFNGSISIHGSNFSNNKADSDGGAVFFGSASGTVNAINNSIFNHNQATNQGGAIYVQSSTLSFNGFLQINNNSATTGVVFALQSTLVLSGITTISENKASFYAFASNITFDEYTKFTNNLHMHDTSVEEGGAVTSFQSEIGFAGTVDFMYNEVQNGYGGAILSSESKVYTYGDTTIAHNTALSGGGIYAYQSELNFKGTTIITENIGTVKGGGIYAVGSAIKLTDWLHFTENRAEKGGGICLELNAKLYVLKHVPQCSRTINGPFCIQGSSLRLYFTNNLAKYGGALYISDDTNSGTCVANTDQSTSRECFFQDLALHSFHDSSLIVRNTHFEGNTANTSGGTIFGGLLDRCTVSPYAQVFNKNQSISLDAIKYLTMVTDLQTNDIKSEISSEPVRVCFCTNNRPVCDNPPPTYTVNKGETFKISLATVDQVRNPISSSVRAFLSSNLGGLAEGQNFQNTSSNCTELNFAITSPQVSEQLVLYADGPCSSLGISQTQVNVTFLPCNCPVGFIKSAQQSNCSCECDPCLNPNHITGCSAGNSSVQRKDNIWISYINTTDQNFRDYRNECQYLIYPHCPFDYCYPSSSVDPVWINLNTPTGPDAQCAFNRTGTLCGSCEDSLSLSLGSSRCMPCSNNWLALLIVFTIAGVALVAFLLVCNLTVAVGTINGLIFYANILTTNRATFFPFQATNFFTVFIAWLNLDFGFVTCFFDGMDGYIKEWLQVAFPIYIIFIVTVVIIACEYSTRIARLFTHTNPVAMLATLILLSYAKSLRVIIAALSSATLEYPDGLRERVWLYDANIRYFEGKHVPLFLVALFILLVGIVYTSVLFSYQWLLRCPNRRALKWIKNARFYPFMDAYSAPYNLKHRYWTGLLLLIRALLYLVAAVNVSGDPSNNLFSIICTLVCLLLLKLLLPGRIYKSWPLDALETSFIFNIVMFSVGSLYIRDTGIGNQEALAHTSTSIAFITFLAILIYHTYAFVLPKKAQYKLNSFKPNRLFSKEENYDHKIIHIPQSVCTHSVVDGIPSQHKLDRENAAAAKLEKEAATKIENEAAAKIETSSLSNSLVTSKQNTDECTPASKQIAILDKMVVDENGMDKDGQQNAAVNIELEPRPSTFADCLDPYIHDSDKWGMERETEIKDFIEVA